MKWLKRFLIAVGVLVVLGAGAAVAVTLLVDVDRYRGEVETRIEAATGKPAEIGHLSLTLWPTLSIQVDDFKLANGKGFPKGQLIDVERIYAELNLDALLERRIQVDSIRIDEPVIRLLSSSRGRWNFEPAAAKTFPSDGASLLPVADSPPWVADTSGPLFSLETIASIEIEDADIKVSSLTKSGPGAGKVGQVHFAAVNLDCDFTNVDLSFLDAGQSSRLSSPAKPGWEAALFPPLLFAAGKKPIARGNIRADSMQLGPFQTTSTRSKVRLFKEEVFLDDLRMNFYGGTAAGNISTNWAGREPRFHSKLKLQGVNGEKLMEAFPDGKGKLAGTVDGEMELRGALSDSPDPLRGIQGGGKMSVKDGKLLGIKVDRLLKLASLFKLELPSEDPRAFSLFSTDLKFENSRIVSKEILFQAPGIRVEAAGVVTPAGKGDLKYEGTLQLTMDEKPWMKQVSMLTEAIYAEGVFRIPFVVSGSFEDQNFATKFKKGLAKGFASQLASSLLPTQSAEGVQGSALEAAQEALDTGKVPDVKGLEKPDAKEFFKGLQGLFGKKKPAVEQAEEPGKEPVGEGETKTEGQTSDQPSEQN